jgi:hypothetical protein
MVLGKGTSVKIHEQKSISKKSVNGKFVNKNPST